MKFKLWQLEEELKRVEGWAGSVGGVAKEREQCVDIKEEVTSCYPGKHIFADLTLFEVGEEELSEWRLKHRESVRRERGEQAGKGAESHDEVASFFIARTFFRPRTNCIAGDEEAGRTRGEGGIGRAVG